MQNGIGYKQAPSTSPRSLSHFSPLSRVWPPRALDLHERSAVAIQDGARLAGFSAVAIHLPLYLFWSVTGESTRLPLYLVSFLRNSDIFVLYFLDLVVSLFDLVVSFLDLVVSLFDLIRVWFRMRIRACLLWSIFLPVDAQKLFDLQSTYQDKLEAVHHVSLMK